MKGDIMNRDEMELLKEEVEEKMANLRKLALDTQTALEAKIDKLYEDELHKTLASINKRLTAIEEKLEDKDAVKEEG